MLSSAPFFKVARRPGSLRAQYQQRRAVAPRYDVTRGAFAWIHVVLGAGIVLWFEFYFAQQVQGGFDILLMPLGLGILFASLGSTLHRLSAGSRGAGEVTRH